MICINKTSQEFKYLAEKYGLSTDTLETIVYKYYIQKNSEDTFPSGTYIKAQIGELPYRESSKQTIEFWNKLYKEPKVFDTSKQMLAAKKEAERYFMPGRVFIYTNNEGKYVLKVQEPVEKLDVTRESFNEEQDWLDYNLAKGTSVQTSIQASISIVQSEEFYSKASANDYVQTLITDGTPRENIQVTYTPETDTEDEYWTVTVRQPQTNKEIIFQLVDYLRENIKHLGLSVKNRADMEKFFKEHSNTLIQMAIGKISINNTLSEAEKENIRTLLKTINKTGTTLLDDGEGTMYLIDHADREDIENRNPKTQDGFNCRLKFSTEGYTSEDINNIKEEIENGNIRNQKDFNRWATNNPKRQGSNNSDSIDVEDRKSNADNVGLDSETQGGEARRRQNNPNSQENFGTGFIRVYGNDGINGPRYTQINDRVNQFFVAPQGEIYGFVDKEGNIYLDETVISPEHPIHEYTHLWDRIVAKKNPKLWQRGVELMKQTSLWNKIADDDNYGKLWQSKGITGDKLTNLIASEVHAKFVGEGGADLLDRLAKEKGQKDIIAKLKDWILEVWKDLKATFSNWSDEEVAKLTLKDFNHMVVRDLADGSLWTKQANNVSEVPIEASLPNYRNFYSISEPITVDAEWKVPILENLDSQLSAANTETENRGIVDQIEWVIEATSEEEYSKADTREKRQLQERIKDYKKKNAQLNNLLDNNLDLTGTEIREVAGQIVDYISDLITEVQQTPEVTKKYWPDLNTSLDLSKESREEIIKVVGINRLLKSAKDYLGNLMNSDDAELEELYDSMKLIKQVHLILKNWDAMLLFAGDFFAVNEKIGLRRNSLTHSYEAIKKKYESFRSEYDDTDDEDDVEKEEERDTQQSWQIESMTISAINSMSDLVKNTLHECYILDKNGKKVLSKFGIPLRVQKSKAVKNILYWTAGADTLDKMIKAIEKKQDTETWTQSLLDKLKDKSGKYADFQSQFFTVMRRHKQLFGVGRKIKNKGTKGRYVSQVVNRNEVRLSLFKAIVANYNANNVPLVNNGRINTRSLEMLRGWHEELRNIIKQSDAEAKKNKYYDYAKGEVVYNSLLSEENLDKAISIIRNTCNALGLDFTPEYLSHVISRNITDTNASLRRLTNSLDKIIKALGSRLSAEKDQRELVPQGMAEGFSKEEMVYKPFEPFFKNSIERPVNFFLEPIAEPMQADAPNTVFDDGKMYQNYVIPSFLSTLVEKLSDHERYNVAAFIKRFYGNSKWFANKEGVDPLTWEDIYEFRTPWLAMLVHGGDYKTTEFEHQVQLNFTDKHYMRNMSPEQLAMSCIANYFCTKPQSDKVPAFFRVPLQSNKPSSEFIKWYSYRGENYKDIIISGEQGIHQGLYGMFLQELDRIDTVRKRNLKKGDPGYIKTWDEVGRTFTFLPFLNDYLIDNGKRVGTQKGNLFRLDNGTVDTEKNNKLEKLLNKKLDAKTELTVEEDSDLIKLVKEAILIAKTNDFNAQLNLWEANGVMAEAAKVENVAPNSVREQLENFLWNDFFASNNILQLTIGDKAFYDGAENMQKRLSELHAPGIRANKQATDYSGNVVSDGYYRTVIFKDFDKFVSNVIDNVSQVFNTLIEQAQNSEKPGLEALKERLVGKHGLFRDINVTDAQAYLCTASYRKKAILFGKWSQKKEAIYDKIKSGDFSLTELEEAFQPLKPFVYGFTYKSMNSEKAPIQTMPAPFQAKNSEYLLVMADALTRKLKSNRPNMLRVISEIMEESEKDHNTKGIDTAQFNSAIKSGEQGAIDLTQFMYRADGEEKAKEYIRGLIYKSEQNEDGTKYNYDVITKLDYDNYAIQQEVPKHFMDHNQTEGSQKRAIMPSGLDEFIDNTKVGEEKTAPENINYYTWTDHNGKEHKYTAKEIADRRERLAAENINDSLQKVIDLFHLRSVDKLERNFAISEILQREIEDNPRYGIDLMQSCQIDLNTGEFRIPKGDPVQSKRIQQLLNSIVKKEVNNQKLPGGPVVQVSNWGTSEQLHIRFNAKSGGLLMLKDEWDANTSEQSKKAHETYPSYEKYTEAEQSGIAYFEVFAPASMKYLYETFKNKDGSINLEAVERCNPDLLKLITFRIPTEEKYSIAHCKIVGFMPALAGEGIMFPYELTGIDGSDFDVDKRYCQYKKMNVFHDKNKEKKLLYKALKDALKDLKQKNPELYQRIADREIPNGGNEDDWIHREVDIFVDNPNNIVRGRSIDEFLAKKHEEFFKSMDIFSAKYYTDARSRRNNEILDIDWAILSNPKTAPKILNPGGFEEEKDFAYAIAAYKALRGRESMDDLSAKSSEELKGYLNAYKDLADLATHLQFYKQNAAGSSLIGIFAVAKVANAILSRDDIYADIKELTGRNSIEVAGNIFTGRIALDPSGVNGAVISKLLGSMIGAAADTAKEAWLEAINVNIATAGVFTTLIRLGMPYKDIAMFMSQSAITSALSEYNRVSLSRGTSLRAVMESRVEEIAKSLHLSQESNINELPITAEELKKGLLSNSDSTLEYKVLRAYLAFDDLREAIKNPTAVTRLNSVSSAAGPNIIDNLITRHKLMKFMQDRKGKTGFYSTKTDNITVDIDDILYEHPVLKAFYEVFNADADICITDALFSDMPTGSKAFAEMIDSSPLTEVLYSDRDLLNKLDNIYQSCMLIANGFVSTKELKYFVHDFPNEFLTERNNEGKTYKEIYADNAFIQAIQPATSRAGQLFLNINTTGMFEQEKERLRMAWADLHKTNPELSTKLFKYAFFRRGINFSPETWMGLLPAYVKEHLTATTTDGREVSYIDTYRHFPQMNGDAIIENLVRNNKDENKLAPIKKIKGGNSKEMAAGKLFVVSVEDRKELAGLKYMRTTSGGIYTLWKRLDDFDAEEEKMLAQRDAEMLPDMHFEKLDFLGNDGEYLELYLEEETKNLEKASQPAMDKSEVSPEEQSSVSVEDSLKEDSSFVPASQATLSTSEQVQTLNDLADLYVEKEHLPYNDAVGRILDLKKAVLGKGTAPWVNAEIQKLTEYAEVKIDKDNVQEWFKEFC